MRRDSELHHEVFYNFEPYSGMAQEAFEIDFLGCRIRHEIWPSALRTGIPQRFYPPLDEEYFEWIDLLQSVIEARGNYTMVELGAGFGRWMVRAAVAMRKYAGLPCHLIGVEAEPLHFSWIPAHFRDNGIDSSAHELFLAAVSDRAGHAHFYVGTPAETENIATEWYGQALVKPYEVPVDACSSSHGGFPVVTHQSGWKTIRVRTISLAEILRNVTHVDLMDLDIQGQELKVISSAIEETTSKVKRLHIATHSREIEEGLREVLEASQWKCTADYPCSSESLTPWGTIAFNDGIQSWVNPKLAS